jgi:hypothetical protein
LWLAIAAVIIVAIGAGLAVAGNGRENDKTFVYSIGLYGDLPYDDGGPQTQAIPRLIADMNSSNIEFVVHDGDLKQGNGPPTCSDALYTKALGWFNSFAEPLIFTPGDNDWTDCDRPNNGNFNSLERLDHERSLFFGTPYSLGAHPMLLEEQGGPPELQCLGLDTHDNQVPPRTLTRKPVPCVENRRWTFKGVTYATFDVQGSCNNRCPANQFPDDVEWAARNAANIQWLDQTFAEAKAQGSAGVMLISQADPGWDGSDGTRAPTRDPITLAENDKQPDGTPTPDGFQAWLQRVRADTVDFGKPVVYVNGDSHYFRVDKPLLDADGGVGGKRIENFTRLETFGDNAAAGANDVQWVKVLVDPSSRDVFAFQPQIVPESIPTYVPNP